MQDNIVYLDRNENNYGPAPKCYEVLKDADFTKLSWYTREFQKGVKSILSNRLANDFSVTEDRILLGYGAEDILKQAVQCYLDEGDKLMIPAYSWWYYKKLASEVNGVNVEYPMTIGEDSFHYDLEKMVEIYKNEKPKMILISSPNNPTGNSLSLEDLKSVLSEFKDTYVILDEAYSYNGLNSHVSDLLNDNPKLLIARTFSKYYALAGVRVGYALLGESLTQLSKFTNRYLGYHRLSEEVALAALDSPEYYQEIAENMRKDKELYFVELNKIPGFKVFKSNANFMLVEIPKEVRDGLKEFLVSRNLHIKFMSEDVLNSHLRITVGTVEQNEKVISAIKEYFA